MSFDLIGFDRSGWDIRVDSTGIGLRAYKCANWDENESHGGIISDYEVDTLFDDISASENTSGHTDYRKVFFKAVESDVLEKTYRAVLNAPNELLGRVSLSMAQGTASDDMSSKPADSSFNNSISGDILLDDNIPVWIKRVITGTSEEIQYYRNVGTAFTVSFDNNLLGGDPTDVNNVIGIEWDSSNSSPELKRIDINGVEIPSATFDAESYFNSHPIHGNMRRCTLTSGGSATFGTDAKGTGLTLTNDYVMVKVPRVYYKFEIVGTRWRWWISPVARSGFRLHHAFYQRGHSASPTNQIYVGAYTAGASGGTTANNDTYNTLYATDWTGLKLTSKSGAKNLTGSGSSGKMDQFEAAGNAIGTGWGLTNFHTLTLLQLLFYIEYASFDSQSKVGLGRTNASNTAAAYTGTYLNQVGEGAGTDIQSLLASNGTYGSTTNDYHSVVWRGIENLWGNIWQFIPGYNTTDTSHRILKRDGTGTIADVMASGSYEEITSPLPVNGVDNISGTDAGAYCHGYVSAFARDSENIMGPMFIPGALNGASNTYLTDYAYSHQSGISQTGVLRASGNWSAGANAGVGCQSSKYGPTYASAVLGGRLEFIG